jgi:hypothetical protein
VIAILTIRYTMPIHRRASNGPIRTIPMISDTGVVLLHNAPRRSYDREEDEEYDETENGHLHDPFLIARASLIAVVTENVSPMDRTRIKTMSIVSSSISTSV